MEYLKKIVESKILVSLFLGSAEVLEWEEEGVSLVFIARVGRHHDDQYLRDGPQIFGVWREW